MNCGRCGNTSFDCEYVTYTEPSSYAPKSGWLCRGCREGVSQ